MIFICLFRFYELKESDPLALHCAHNAFENSVESKISNRRETVRSEYYVRLVSSIHFAMQRDFS